MSFMVGVVGFKWQILQTADALARDAQRPTAVMIEDQEEDREADQREDGPANR
jgi:hypothetical protein